MMSGSTRAIPISSTTTTACCRRAPRCTWRGWCRRSWRCQWRRPSGTSPLGSTSGTRRSTGRQATIHVASPARSTIRRRRWCTGRTSNRCARMLLWAERLGDWLTMVQRGEVLDAYRCFHEHSTVALDCITQLLKAGKDPRRIIVRGRRPCRSRPAPRTGFPVRSVRKWRRRSGAATRSPSTAGPRPGAGGQQTRQRPA